MVDFANLCLESNSKNEVIYSEDVFAKATITLIGKMNNYIAFEGKKRLKNTLSEDYETICEQAILSQTNF